MLWVRESGFRGCRVRWVSWRVGGIFGVGVVELIWVLFCLGGVTVWRAGLY